MSAAISDLIQELQPFAQALVDLAAVARVAPRVTSTFRTRGQQERLYRAYLRGETHYPVAPPGTSAHEFGFAFDMVADSTEDLHDLGTVWTQWGGIWSPSDEVHFEYPGFVRPEVPVDTPGSEQNVVQEAANLVNALPWYATIFLPTAVTTTPGTFQEASRGSLGSKLLCKFGASSFC